MLKVAAVLCLCLSAVLAATTGDRGSRVAGGTDAFPAEYPYIVSVQRFLLLRANHVCGGTILNEFHVLSAAQCFASNLNSRYRVQAGKLSLNQFEITEQTINVLNFVIHPSYDQELSPFNIAVVRLASPFGFTAFIQPVALPMPDIIPSGIVRFAGWGSTSVGLLPSTPALLQQARVAVFPNAACQAVMADSEVPELTPITPLHVCLGPVTGGISSCSGDAGGPVVQVVDGRHELVGILSWSPPICGIPGVPTVTVRASAHIAWINSVIDPIPEELK